MTGPGERQVLIAVDDSPRGEDAVALGRLIAEVLAARPAVVTVARIPAHMLGEADLQATLEARTRPTLDRAAEKLAPLDPVLQVIPGESPGRALHELVDSTRPLAVVVGSTHRGRIGRLFPGSTASMLLHGAPCAVAVAPVGFAQDDQRRLLRLGVALDGGEEAWWALQAGIGLAERLHATLTLLAAREPINGAYAAYPGASAAMYASTAREWWTRALDRAAKRIPEGLPFERRLLGGPAAPTLVQASADLDLLLMGSRGYGPAMRTLLGSVSSKVIAQAACPVLILPRHAGPNPLRLPDVPRLQEAPPPGRALTEAGELEPAL